MLHTIETINTSINNFVWGIPAMTCIIGVGLYLSIGTGFIQLRKLGYSMKMTLGKIFTQKQAKEGSITPFQAVCTALASTVGTGNIAGVAGAMRAGEVVNERKRTNSKAAGKAFLFFIIIVIAAACAYFYYKANKSKIDNTLKSTAAKVENTTKKVVKDGQEATSRDSRYKRTRERLVK